MILVDTTPLVALCSPRDALHRRALADLDRISRRPFAVCAAVLTEAAFLLRHAVQRRRLERVLEELSMIPFALEDDLAGWAEIFGWLRRFEEHEPDWADAYLAVSSSHDRSARVWTYDVEFTTTWRRLDGSAIPMAVR